MCRASTDPRGGYRCAKKSGATRILGRAAARVPEGAESAALDVLRTVVGNTVATAAAENIDLTGNTGIERLRYLLHDELESACAAEVHRLSRADSAKLAKQIGAPSGAHIRCGIAALVGAVWALPGKLVGDLATAVGNRVAAETGSPLAGKMASALVTRCLTNIVLQASPLSLVDKIGFSPIWPLSTPVRRSGTRVESVTTRSKTAKVGSRSGRSSSSWKRVAEDRTRVSISPNSECHAACLTAVKSGASPRASRDRASATGRTSRHRRRSRPARTSPRASCPRACGRDIVPSALSCRGCNAFLPWSSHRRDRSLRSRRPPGSRPGAGTERAGTWSESSPRGLSARQSPTGSSARAASLPQVIRPCGRPVRSLRRSPGTMNL